MRLYEHEGKALLAQHGVQVPRGAVWPAMPDVEGPWVVKAQVLAGKRGKLGGIRFASDLHGCGAAAEALLGSCLGEMAVERVYVEEWLDIERELYVAILVDRDHRSPLLLASRRGGMDVEDSPGSDMARVPIDPLLGLRPFVVRYLMNWLGLNGDVAAKAAVAIEGMYAAFTSAEAEIIEVNPLVVTRDGRVIAADAKVTLDDEAGFRHPERTSTPREGTVFERGCAAAGTVGVEMDGDVAIVVSGAGLMMATIDLLGASGARLRAAIDLGGMAFGTPAQLAKILRLVIGLSPKVILINAYFNLAFCDQLAQGVVEGFDGQRYAGRVVVRLRGRKLAEAKAILSPLGLTSFDDLPSAIASVVGSSREVHTSPS